MASQDIAQVALPIPVNRTLDYLLPETISGCELMPGMRVLVPLGNRKLVGLVMARQQATLLPPQRLRAIDAILDEKPLLGKEILDLLNFAANYYQHPIGIVVNTALPQGLRRDVCSQARKSVAWRVREHARPDHPALSRTPRQQELLVFMHNQSGVTDPLTAACLATFGPTWRSLLRTLVEKDLVEVLDNSSHQASFRSEAALILNPEQEMAVHSIWPGSRPPGFGIHLLDGITGSGKTEVYMALIRLALNLGKQVLILVPEIGLTPQMTSRLRRRFSVNIAASHSGLSESKRRLAWLDAMTGRADIVLGTRSAIFTPLPRLGLLIVDEEHDPSFKQQDGFRYHARDLAIWRSRRHDIPVILGSATPSLESIHHAQNGRYYRHRLTHRATGAQLPEMHIVDIRHDHLEAGLSAPLIQAMRERLVRNEQVLLFLNRRGYAPVLICHACGWLAGCPHCDARLTYHAGSARLRCHQCGHEEVIPTVCPACAAKDIQALGQGTERIETVLKQIFPTAGILRIDRDTTRGKDRLYERLQMAKEGRFPILLGTQMLTKGHHFPRVTLVGVVDADQGLFSMDYRAHERLAQLLVQVAGRAGRAGLAGEVIVQTHQPDHLLFHVLLTQGYEGATRLLLAEREETRMPPYGYLALVRAEAVHKGAALDFLQGVRAMCQEIGSLVAIMGPVPAPMERRAGRYRAQLLLHAGERTPLHRLLSSLVPRLSVRPAARQVRWSVDVDPVDLY